MALKAIQFGAGNVGRGFTAQLFTESGYEVVFVDVVDEIVRLVNERRSYPIEIVGDNPQTVIVRNVRAVHGAEREAVAREILDASLVCTAVGVNALRQVAPTIAMGIKLRADGGVSDPLNIIICENLLHASDVLRGYILEELPQEYADYIMKNVGFVESVVSRMVPVMTEEQRWRDPLLVAVEEYKKLPVARTGFVGDIPQIVGFQPYDNFQAYVERKLFTHNLGHAAAAYLGYLRGHEYVYQAVRDPVVRAVVEKALAETGEALIRRHGFTPEEHQEHIDDLLQRFANVALGDTVARVGRDPIRKLGPDDRLIGGAELAMSYGITPRNVCLAAAAALMYDNPDDPAAAELRRTIQVEGLDRVFEAICGIAPDSELAQLIREQMDVLSSGRWPGGGR
ncbi:MAG TPA: mannitol-1-phosphate 5-dehydrogenase [Armatimonadota bacterium]|nr:mannitol-1-phosphate 5-dehydrogenase [Armatimonadota bacterium]